MVRSGFPVDADAADEDPRGGGQPRTGPADRTETNGTGCTRAKRTRAERRAVFWAEVRHPVTRYLRVGSVLWLVSWLSIELLNRHPTYSKPPVSFRGTAFLEGWMRWDGNWYLEAHRARTMSSNDQCHS